jgi:hypothetical protein
MQSPLPHLSAIALCLMIGSPAQAQEEKTTVTFESLTLVGAVGVSGAPSGENDEKCAKAGIAAIKDKIAF